jgi:microsomal dipeptidase-like Zn-dependent dipeptidase
MSERVKVLGLGVALGLAGALSVAQAEVCKDERVIEDLWEKYDAVARSVGCASPARGPFQFIACLDARPVQRAIKVGDHMVGYWNSMAQGGWATIGPRMLGPTWEDGTILGTTGRTFVTTAPANTAKATVRITKTDGRNDTEVTICATRKGEKPRVISNFRIEANKDNDGRDVVREFTNVSDSFISVHLDGKSLLPTDKFAYKIKMEAEPVKWDFGPIEKGWADLHVHQAAELAHAGTMYYGGHDGPIGTALKACSWRQHGLPFNPGKYDQYHHGEGAPSLKDWPHHLDIGHQQVHAQWLEAAWRSGLKLMVVSAVNSEPGCRLFSTLHPRPGTTCLDMPNLNAQLDAFIKFDEAHDWYEIAVDPWHARKIINEGKLAVVVSLESSHIFPASNGDIVEQLDQMYAKGVRTMQPTHEVDSRFSGAAPWSNMFEVLQTAKYPVDFSQGFIGAVKSLGWGFEYETVTRDGHAGKFNRVGLKSDGYKLIDAMVARHMPVDIAHMSVKASEDTYAHLRDKHQRFPMYVSHTRFGSLMLADDAKKQQEFMTSEGQIDMVKDLGGMVGLRPGPQGIKVTPQQSDGAIVDARNECAGTTRSYRNLIAYGQRRQIKMALGTDFNGNTSMMGSRFKRGQTGCPGGGTPEAVAPPPGVGADFVQNGLRHIGLIGDMMADLRSLDASAASAIDNSAENFLKMWERAWAQR